MMPLFCRVAAAPDPAYMAALKRSAAGSQFAAMMPLFAGWRPRLTRPTGGA
ncbi:hypothetical protein ACXEHV_000100 [Klebsiella quasipneumoniae]|nr:hypothetical protein [Klebsiella quasipneumoniae subsp. quasipneumoniae]